MGARRSGSTWVVPPIVAPGAASSAVGGLGGLGRERQARFDAMEVLGELLGGLVAVLGRLRERAQDDVVEVLAGSRA